MLNIDASVMQYEAPNGKIYSLDVSAMKQPLMYLLQYGLDQNLADAHAGAKAWAIKQLSDDKAKADIAWNSLSEAEREAKLHTAIDVLVSKRIAALMAGTVRGSGAKGPQLTGIDFHLDAILSEASSKYKALKRAERAPLLAQAKENPKLVAMAQSRIDAAAALGDMGLDI